MIPKVLFTASIAKHILRFHLPYLKWFKEQGFEVHVACEGEEEIPFCDKRWYVPFVRTPYSHKHISVYKQLKNILDKEAYQLVHCHTPMASIVTRLAAKKARKKGTKVLYTAHGFHFYKGAGKVAWFFYYPIEKALSKHCDAIITINSEDYELAKSEKFFCDNVYLIPGIGVDSTRFRKFNNEEKINLREDNGYNSNQLLIIYVAEYIYRKNHAFLVNAMPELIAKFPNVKLLLAGRGELFESIQEQVKKLNIQEHVDMLGFRSDVDVLMGISDIGISCSRQEGLGLNLVEEMMCGLPVVATVDRGHKEIIKDGINGYFYPQEDKKQFVNKIEKILSNPELRYKMGNNALGSSKKFSLDNSIQVMAEIYKRFI